MVWRRKIDTGLERCWPFFCPPPPPNLHLLGRYTRFGDAMMACGRCDGIRVSSVRSGARNSIDWRVGWCVVWFLFWSGRFSP
jgi:hypothetical protein